MNEESDAGAPVHRSRVAAGWYPTISLDELVEANRRLAAIDNQYGGPGCPGSLRQQVGHFTRQIVDDQIQSALLANAAEFTGKYAPYQGIEWPQRLVEAFMSPALTRATSLTSARPRRRG